MGARREAGDRRRAAHARRREDGGGERGDERAGREGPIRASRGRGGDRDAHRTRHHAARHGGGHHAQARRQDTHPRRTRRGLRDGRERTPRDEGEPARARIVPLPRPRTLTTGVRDARQSHAPVPHATHG